MVGLEIAVAWGDMDAFGHVNNTVYFRFFESVRIEFFQAVGVPHRNIGQSCGPILASTSCQFKVPLAYPDRVRVETTVRRIGTKSFTMAYRVQSLQQEALAAEGEGVVVWFDYAAGSTAPIPSDLRARLEEHVAVP